MEKEVYHVTITCESDNTEEKTERKNSNVSHLH